MQFRVQVTSTKQPREYCTVLHQGETSSSCVLSNVFDGAKNSHRFSFRGPLTRVYFRNAVASKREDPLLMSLWLQGPCPGSRRASVCFYCKGVIPVKEHECEAPFFCIGGRASPYPREVGTSCSLLLLLLTFIFIASDWSFLARHSSQLLLRLEGGWPNVLSMLTRETLVLLPQKLQRN